MVLKGRSGFHYIEADECRGRAAHQHPPIPAEPLGLEQAAPAAAHPLQGRGQLPAWELLTRGLIPSHFVLLPHGAMLSKA